MPQMVSAQIKLRRAFRYGYFAFLGGIGLALALLALRPLNGDAATLLSFSFPGVSLWPMMALLVLGLCVPLFFACWLLIGTAVLGRSPQRPPLGESIAD